MDGKVQFSMSPQQPKEWVKGRAIGYGSFGTINLAMNTRNGSLFVVKSAESGSALHSLQNEFDIVETLDSPYIIRSLGKQSSSIHFEYMAGGSLFDLAEKFGGALDERVIRSYTKQILKGLKYLHEKGIVHCDLKCKNVLLDSSGNIKLADFGCAKRLKNNESVHSRPRICGTPLWMAPEVLRNEAIGSSSDIWSLGCMVIEMATGRPPWSDSDSDPMAAVLRIACSGEIPRLPLKFSKGGLDFLGKCLERNSERRWTAEELLSHPFVSKKNSRREETDAPSPASVLDFGMNEVDYASDESGSLNEEHPPNRIPFLLRNRSSNGRRRAKSHSVSADNWVAVRSG